MANNIDVTPGSGKTVASEEISSTQYQKVKLVDATASSTTGTGIAANPFQVSLANTGANGTPIVVTGAVTGGGGTQYTEDAAAAANPIGNAINLVRADIPAGVTSADGDNVAQRGTDFGAGYVTAVNSGGTFVDFAVESGGNLEEIFQNTEVLISTIHAEDTASAPGDTGELILVVRSDAGGTLVGTDGDYSALQVDANGALRVTGGGGGTQYTEDAAAAANPIGTALNIIRADTPAGITSADGDNLSVRGTDFGAAYVTLLDTAGSPVSVGGGTQYTEDAAAAANPIGTALIMVRDDARSGSLTSADGDNIVPRGTNAGEIYVKHVDTVNTAVADIVGTPAALGSLNAAASVAVAGKLGAGAFFAVGTLVGTVTPEYSGDGGTSWFATYFLADTPLATFTFASAFPAIPIAIEIPSGATHVRVRVSAYTSGTLNATLRATARQAPTQVIATYMGQDGAPLTSSNTSSGVMIGGTDGTNFRNAIFSNGTPSTEYGLVTRNIPSGTQQVSGSGDFTVTLAAGAASIAKAEDSASANLDVGAAVLGVRQDTPANTGADGDYEFLKLSAGRLWTSAVVTAVPADPFGVNADAASATGSISAKLRFIASTGIPITGTVTVASHAVTNAGTFVVQENGAALTALQLIDDVIFTDDAAFTPGTSKVAAIGMQADEASTDSVDEGDIGAPRMTLDRKQIVVAQPHTNGGCLVANMTSGDTFTALTNSAQAIKASAGQLYGWYIYNPNATAAYVNIYNIAAASVTVGTSTPQMNIVIPATSAANILGAVGIEFTNAGFSASATTTGGGNTAPGTALEANFFYK